ncbi:MAG: hypothetical protein AAB295_04475, partial [Chloroflexota bacterium]
MTWRGRVAVFLALAVLVVACGAPPATTVPSPTATMPEPSAVAAVATATPTPTPTPTARPVSYIPPACQGRPIVTARPGATPQPTATPQPDKPIERSLQLRVLETLAGRIEERYLYPDFNGKDLTNFYTWLVDHKHQDPDRVFTVVDQIDGAPAIRSSG